MTELTSTANVPKLQLLEEQKAKLGNEELTKATVKENLEKDDKKDEADEGSENEESQEEEEEENEEDELIGEEGSEEGENEYYFEEEFRNPMETLLFGPARELRRRKRQSQAATDEPDESKPAQGTQNQPGSLEGEDEDDDSSVEYNDEDKGIMWIGHTYGLNNTYVPPLMNTYGLENPVDEDAYDTDTFRRWFFKVVGVVSYWSGMGRHQKKITNPDQTQQPNSENSQPEPPSITDKDALPRPLQ